MTACQPLILDISDTADEWQDSALCAQTDPDAFFPDKGGSVREAKRVCRVCPVRTECLAHALEHDERFGIWGGLTDRERRALKRRQQTPVPVAAPCAAGTGSSHQEVAA